MRERYIEEAGTNRSDSGEQIQQLPAGDGKVDDQGDSVHKQIVDDLGKFRVGGGVDDPLLHLRRQFGKYAGGRLFGQHSEELYGRLPVQFA